MRRQAAIASLQVEDLVADDQGRIGEVKGFQRDRVRITWEGNLTSTYSDDDLCDRGIVFVEGAR